MDRERKNILFIINPFAGRKRKNKLPQLIKSSLPPEGFSYDIVYTKCPGHAIELSKNALKAEVDAIVAVGGDGTVNEVASSIVNENVALGIVPGGSGNGLSMHLGIGRNMAKSLEKIRAFNIKTIDTAKVNDRLYVNMAGVGIDGLVAYKTKMSASRGFSTYFKGAIWEGLKYKNLTYKVEIDGKEYEDKFLSVNVANGSMFGYHFTVAPGADAADGLMDTLMIHDAHKVDYFGNAWRFFVKRIHKSPFASTDRSTSIKITSYEDTFMHVDGEGYPCEAGEFEFIVQPQSLEVIC